MGRTMSQVSAARRCEEALGAIRASCASKTRAKKCPELPSVEHGNTGAAGAGAGERTYR